MKFCKNWNFANETPPTHLFSRGDAADLVQQQQEQNTDQKQTNSLQLHRIGHWGIVKRVSLVAVKLTRTATKKSTYVSWMCKSSRCACTSVVTFLLSLFSFLDRKETLRCPETMIWNCHFRNNAIASIFPDFDAHHGPVAVQGRLNKFTSADLNRNLGSWLDFYPQEIGENVWGHNKTDFSTAITAGIVASVAWEIAHLLLNLMVTVTRLIVRVSRILRECLWCNSTYGAICVFLPIKRRNIRVRANVVCEMLSFLSLLFYSSALCGQPLTIEGSQWRPDSPPRIFYTF